MIRGILGSGIASEIVPGLWQGGYPKRPASLSRQGIDMLVLAAREIQPPWETFPPGLEVVYAPMHDNFWDGPSEDEAQIALSAASDVSRALDEGKTVLVTCAMGINRSGLINALVLMDREGLTGLEAVRRVRAARPGALNNTSFVHWLASL